MKTYSCFLIALIFLAGSCRQDNYSLSDFGKVGKFDAHFHIYGGKNQATAQAIRDNFRLLCINTNSEGCDVVIRAQHELDSLKNLYPEELEYTATFCLDGWDKPGWQEKTIAWIDSCLENGAVAVKAWKNIGMEFRDSSNQLVMIDNPRFDPIFKHLVERGIPLVAHMGEPKNCWLPLTEMTTKNDSSYFAAHPQYHMFLHPEMPSYEDQMVARDRMLEKHPDLIFIGCHLASLEWSVDELARFLDRFPHAAVDLSARMGQLFYQTCDDRGKVRKFFMDYQDRILYGTDIIDSGRGDEEAFRKRLHDAWSRDWEYLVADNEMSSPLIKGTFRGLKLPKTVVDKIYFRNAITWYKLEGD